MQEYLNPLVDYIHDISTKNTVLYEGLVIFPLEVVNMERPCHHRLAEGSIYTHVVPGNLKDVSCAVAELLGRGGHVEFMVQELAHLFLGD